MQMPLISKASCVFSSKLHMILVSSDSFKKIELPLKHMVVCCDVSTKLLDGKVLAAVYVTKRHISSQEQIYIYVPLRLGATDGFFLFHML